MVLKTTEGLINCSPKLKCEAPVASALTGSAPRICRTCCRSITPWPSEILRILIRMFHSLFDILFYCFLCSFAKLCKTSNRPILILKLDIFFNIESEVLFILSFKTEKYLKKYLFVNIHNFSEMLFTLSNKKRRNNSLLQHIIIIYPQKCRKDFNCRLSFDHRPVLYHIENISPPSYYCIVVLHLSIKLHLIRCVLVPCAPGAEHQPEPFQKMDDIQV